MPMSQKLKLRFRVKETGEPLNGVVHLNERLYVVENGEVEVPEKGVIRFLGEYKGTHFEFIWDVANSTTFEVSEEELLFNAEALDVNLIAGIIVEEINRRRNEAGLDGLSWSKKLMEVAELRCIQIMTEFNHSYNRRDAGDFMLEKGYYFFSIGENIYRIEGIKRSGEEKLAERIVAGWMESRGHRLNVLGNFTHIGVAVKVKRRTLYCTALFGELIFRSELENSTLRIIGDHVGDVKGFVTQAVVQGEGFDSAWLYECDGKTILRYWNGDFSEKVYFRKNVCLAVRGKGRITLDFS